MKLDLLGTSLLRAIVERRAPVSSISEPLASKGLSMKLYLWPNVRIDAEVIELAFRRWIHESPEIHGELVDVLTHPQGPWVMLIGTHAQWTIDGREGRPGLRFTKRRHVGPMNTADDVLGASLLALLAAARRLEREAWLRFVTDELELELGDRLRAPNTGTTFDLVAPELRRFAIQVFDGPELEASSALDPEGPFRARIFAADRKSLAELEDRTERLGTIIKG
ncbi:hypothetical protein L6R52_15570 [Myxococcota bacterium]|nr:hypothetical protein [Myxococcota bacterium]